MSDRLCVIIEERRNPPIKEQRAVTIWRRDTYKDNPVTMEESAYRGAESCHYVEKERYLLGQPCHYGGEEVTYRGAGNCRHIGTELKQLSKIDRRESRRSLMDTDNCRLATPFWLCHRTTLTTVD
jgi:hypothetical protein